MNIYLHKIILVYGHLKFKEGLYWMSDVRNPRDIQRIKRASQKVLKIAEKQIDGGMEE